MARAADRYRERMARVVEHVDRHLDEVLDVAALARVAAFSPCHFHRQFGAFFGVAVHRYVQLARMKRAAERLATAPATTVTEIALEAGYDAPDAFARAFRQRFGQAPSAFRAAPDHAAWRAAFRPYHRARSKLMTTFSLSDVDVRTVAATRVATMTHLGHPDTIHATVRRLIDWRMAHGLTADNSTTWGVFPTDTRTTAPEQFRMELCVGTDQPVALNDAGVVAGEIPGGRVAVLRVHGAAGDDLAEPALFLYRDWLPASGEELRDFPLYCQRVAFAPLVPADEAITDLFLPLR